MTSAATRRRTSLVETLENRRLLAVPSALGGNDRWSVDFTQDWQFIRQDVSGAQAPNFNDNSWSSVDLPHTYNASDGANGGNDYYRGGTWYRKDFAVPSKWKARRILLNVGAASTHAQVYVNGNLVGEHKGAHSAFTDDITGSVTPGQTATIAIRVDNTYDADLPGYQGDFTIFGGLTRGVSLFATSKLAINPDDFGGNGIQIGQRDVTASSAKLDVSASVRNRDSKNLNYTLRTSLVDAKGKVVAQTSSNFTAQKGKTARARQTLNVSNPRRWDGVADPYLYTTYTQILQDGVVYDTVSQKMGIRSLSMSSSGLKLNGKLIQLRGVNLHDDKQGVGSAMTANDREKDIKLLTDMGANALRFAHWQVDQDYYDLADEAGLIVWTEIPLWRRITVSQAFTDNSLEAMRELIHQNYNHASIAYWGLHNELPNDGNVISLLNQLQTLAKLEDPTRFTIGATELDNPATINGIPDYSVFNKYWGWYGNYNEDADTRLDRFGPWLAAQKNTSPGKPLGMGEYGAGASVDHHVSDPRDGAPPSDPNATQIHPEEYQAYLHERTWEQVEASPTRVFANFIWQFTDSANDNRNEGSQPGINDKGLMTYDRNTQKDAYYYYKAQWSDTPTLYVTSKRFTERTESETPVKVYSNLGVNVTLRVNGVSQGVRNDSDGVLEWDEVTLAPGLNTIEVTASKGGKNYVNTARWTLVSSARGAGLAGATIEPSTEPSIEPSIEPSTPTAATRETIAAALFGADAAIV